MRRADPAVPHEVAVLAPKRAVAGAEGRGHGEEPHHADVLRQVKVHREAQPLLPPPPAEGEGRHLPPSPLPMRRLSRTPKITHAAAATKKIVTPFFKGFFPVMPFISITEVPGISAGIVSAAVISAVTGTSVAPAVSNIGGEAAGEQDMQATAWILSQRKQGCCVGTELIPRSSFFHIKS